MNYWDILNKYLDGGKKKDSKVTVVMLNPPQNWFYTGKGADGVVQANKPAGVDYGTNPPSVYHEDEFVRKGQNGQLLQVQPSPVTMAKSEGEQQEIAKQQNLNDWPGYQTGFNTATTDNEPLPPFSEGYNEGTSQLPTGEKRPTAPYIPPQHTAGQGSAMSTVANTATPVTPYQPIYAGTSRGGFGTAAPYKPPQHTAYQGSAMAGATNPLRSVTPAPTQTTPSTYVRPPAMWETGAQEGYAGIRDVARGQSEAADLAREKSMDYLAGTSAGQLGAAQQQWLSAGVSPETMAALTQQAMRSQDITRGGVMKDLAISEAERAEGAQKELITGAATLQGLETSKQALETARYNLDTLKRTTEGTRFAALLQGHFDAGTDWKSDPGVRVAAQAAWEANGMAGPVPDSWIESQSGMVNVNDIDVAMRSMESSEWFTGLPEADQEAIRKGFGALAGIGALGGIKVTEDANGNLVFTNIEGDVVYSTGAADAGQTPVDKSVSDLTEDATVISSYLGGEVITPDKVKEFNASFGRGMANENDAEYLDAFKTWFGKQGDMTNLTDYIKGDSTVMDSDTAKTLEAVASVLSLEYEYKVGNSNNSISTGIVIAKYRDGSLSDSQKKTVMEATGTSTIEDAIGKLLEPAGISYEQYDSTLKTMEENPTKMIDGGSPTPHSVNDGRKSKKGGTLHYPEQIYTNNGRYIKFNDSTLAWIDSNKGKVVEHVGKKYIIDPTKPVNYGVIFNDNGVKVDRINLISLDDGTTISIPLGEVSTAFKS